MAEDERPRRARQPEVPSSARGWVSRGTTRGLHRAQAYSCRAVGLQGAAASARVRSELSIFCLPERLLQKAITKQKNNKNTGVTEEVSSRFPTIVQNSPWQPSFGPNSASLGRVGPYLASLASHRPATGQILSLVVHSGNTWASQAVVEFVHMLANLSRSPRGVSCVPF